MKIYTCIYDEQRNYKLVNKKLVHPSGDILIKNIEQVEIINVGIGKKCLASLGWGTLGALSFGVFGAVGGAIFGGNVEYITFIVTLKDGIEFGAIAETKAFDKLVECMGG